MALAPVGRGSTRERKYTRLEVSRRLGITVESVRRAELRGELEPHLDDKGVIRYAARDVAAWEAKRARGRSAGAIAQHAFRLFRERTPLVDVVEELGIPIADVRSLHAEYLALREADPSEPLPPAARRSA